MSGHDDYADEPIPGLPARLPEGETILWQGAPNWRVLARHGYHVTSVAVYFALLVSWRIVIAFQSGETVEQALLGATWLITLGLGALLVLALLAFLSARSTIYTITSQRVLMRFGVALPMTINIPFSAIESAWVKHIGNDVGDIALQTSREQRVAYLVTWPHVRPWRITRPQPSLRALDHCAHAAAVLSAAIQARPIPDAVLATTPSMQPVPTGGLDVVTA